MDPAETRRAANLNLIESSKQLFELDSGAELADEGRWLFGAGRHPHPAITNAGFRRDDDADGAEMVAAAHEFFGPRGRGFSFWVRGDVPEDGDLAAAASEGGLNMVYETPEMVRREPVDAPEPTGGAELRRLERAEQAADYWRVCAEAYVDLEFPPEVFANYDRYEGLLADNIAAFLGYAGSVPVAASMTVVSDGVAGIYWVATLAAARGMGLGRAMTAAATNAGFELGAELASLQASAMGKPIYEAMGYETIYPYRLFMAPVPEG